MEDRGEWQRASQGGMRQGGGLSRAALEQHRSKFAKRAPKVRRTDSVISDFTFDELRTLSQQNDEGLETALLAAEKAELPHLAAKLKREQVRLDYIKWTKQSIEVRETDVRPVLKVWKECPACPEEKEIVVVKQAKNEEEDYEVATVGSDLSTEIDPASEPPATKKDSAAELSAPRQELRNSTTAIEGSSGEEAPEVPAHSTLIH
eukprot:TRINITY_DN16137_c0_g1_i4.p1 TRINITY_DN16137_c0_g1~~TRINITY_DN16137_c0_g1_i4.p1  ORF type:complete len:205 (+),score=61.45 TRINITY_DN16137_c0_g1_i4:170-784(+)